jgi:6,7-dimethyl-8-ribityllumazine synthase
MAEFNGIVTGEGRRFVVLASRFNHHITEKLAEGALDALVRHGAAAEDVDVVWVPGAWELPYAARRLAATERYNALVVVGAVVRGDTPHFEYIASEVTRGLGRIMADHGLPVAFGVLTTDTIEQALDRAGAHHGNKGYEAAVTAIEMARLGRVLG